MLPGHTRTEHVSVGGGKAVADAQYTVEARKCPGIGLTFYAPNMSIHEGMEKGVSCPSAFAPSHDEKYPNNSKAKLPPNSAKESLKFPGNISHPGSNFKYMGIWSYSYHWQVFNT